MKTRSSESLLPSFSDQDRIFSKAFAILHEAIEQHAFPAASIAITHAGKLSALKAFGSFVYKEDAQASLSRSVGQGGDFDVPQVTPETLFDLASLTKPVATTTMAMLLHERGLLELDAPVVGVVPEFDIASDSRRRSVTFRMLLAHSSGLPAYEKLFVKAHSREELLSAAFQTPLTADPGVRAEYSDIGFIILGIALERVAQDSLDAFCQREVFGPLGLANTTFSPPIAMRGKIPPTADETKARAGPGLGPGQAEHSAAALFRLEAQQPRSTFRGRIIQGEVQDENASVLGGVAGHAGLFSTSEDLARFAQMLLNTGAPLLRPETVELFTRRQSEPIGTTRTLGWDTPSNPSQSGKYLGARSFGHLGYTGTSLWIDPDRQLSITLLTNRTWPDCSNQAIKQVRPEFHDAIVEALV
jgi:CubicO group peptidase (beta-lactamase class C family)